MKLLVALLVFLVWFPVIILIAVRRIRRELIPGIHHTAPGRPVADGIIGEDLRGGEEWMRGGRQPIERVILKCLTPPPIRQTGSVSHRVIGIGRLIDLGTRGRELMQDIRHLRSGIVGVRRLHVIESGKKAVLYAFLLSSRSNFGRVSACSNTLVGKTCFRALNP